MNAIDSLRLENEAKIIAAWRYLAYLDSEYRFLRHELQAGPKDGYTFVPCDRHVNLLNPGDGTTGPLDRAEGVLRHLGIDPYAHAPWVDYLGIDLSQIPIIGSVGDGGKFRPARKKGGAS